MASTLHFDQASAYAKEKDLADYARAINISFNNPIAWT